MKRRVYYEVWCRETDNLLAEFDTHEEAKECVDGDESLVILEIDEPVPSRRERLRELIQERYERIGW